MFYMVELKNLLQKNKEVNKKQKINNRCIDFCFQRRGYLFR